jgi:hypothetical protein
MFFKRGKQLDRIEAKLDMITNIVLDTQMSIQTGGQERQQKIEAVKNYIGTLKTMLEAKGLDTTMFDNLEPLMGIKK